MADRTAAPSGGDAAGQDVLLATKLFVPRPPAGLVARPRLAAALADGRAGGLAGIARRRGDSEQMDVLTRQARAHLSADNEALRPMADLYLAVADQLRGRTAEAERSLAAAVADQHTTAGRYLAVNIACDLGRVRRPRQTWTGHCAPSSRRWRS
jgi:hypothetical protein